MENYLDIIIFSAGFLIIALASRQIGDYFKTMSLPLISGFLFTGILAGPYLLDLISFEALAHLRFVDEVSLAFIAFAAGSELYLKDMKNRMNSIKWVTLGLVSTTFIAGSLAVYFLSSWIPFMQSMSATGRLAVAILAGSILVARSPSSAIAIINEMRAKGPFTQTVLGVTVISDVVVIALFATSSSLANALLTNLGVNFRFIFILFLDLSLSVCLGYLVSLVLKGLLSIVMNRRIKTVFILLAGYGVYLFSSGLHSLSEHYLGVGIFLEPLLVCMIAGFWVANYSNYRMEFSKILYEAGPVIYIAFFTLTGASLRLDVLATTWTIALALFFFRMGTIFVGGFGGGLIAGDPAEHNRLSWMAYITQAGVGLGLAKAVVVEFPEWGVAFATMMIAVIVLNQIIGPPLMKQAISMMGENHSRGESLTFARREAIIFGLEGQALALARLLQSHGWAVRVADQRVSSEETGASDVKLCRIPDLTLGVMEQLNAGQAEAIIVMLSDDENYHICELAYEHFGTSNLVVRLNDRSNFNRFHELGALVVDPSTAIVSLLDQFVRSPSAASLLLGMEKDQKIAELEVRNPNLEGAALRDLRLPLDTIILSIRRRGQMLISHGYTRLEVGDWVTLVGMASSLKEVELRFGVNREQALTHLVEKVTAKEFASRSLQAEVTDIIRQDAGQPRDRFDRFVEEATVLDIRQTLTVESFFKQAAAVMTPRLGVEPQELMDQLLEREKESSTAISPSVAIPHIIVQGEHRFNILLARCREGIVFSESAPMVYAVFLLAGTRDERNFHLRALSAIAQIVQNPTFEKKWLRARNEKALRDVVLKANRQRQ